MEVGAATRVTILVFPKVVFAQKWITSQNGMILWALVLILQEEELVAQADALPSYCTPHAAATTLTTSHIKCLILDVTLTGYESNRTGFHEQK